MRYILRIDDFPMNRDHAHDEGLLLFRELNEVFKKYNIPYILAVIPDLCKTEDYQFIADNQHITTTQHGYKHHKFLDNQMRSEFIETSFDEKLNAIRNGAGKMPYKSDIFIPPMNWFDDDMVKILKCYEFLYLLGFGIEMPKYLGSALTYIPCSPKFYNPAYKVIPMVEEMEGVDGYSFITLHCNWEYPLSSAPETLCKLIKDDVIPFSNDIFNIGYPAMPTYSGISVARRMGFDWILQRISSGFKILEFGCSNSVLPTVLALKGNLVTGVDVNEEELNGQKANMERWNAKYDCVVADGRNLPFADNTFDIVTASHSILCAVDDDEKVVKELCRVLRPNGYLLMASKFSNKATYIETNRQDPVKVRNWTDIEDGFIKPNNLRIIDKAFLQYDFGTDKGEWCRPEEANCIYLEVKK